MKRAPATIFRDCNVSGDAMNPNTSLDERFGDAEAEPTPWSTAEQILDTAGTYWVTTVRRDGRPHVTTLLAVWVDDALNFVTGENEQEAVNLRAGLSVREFIERDQARPRSDLLRRQALLT
jgi:pyridoxamine 5'-phosphate oxidase-like protein